MWKPDNYPGLRFLANYNICALRFELFMASDVNGMSVPQPIIMETHTEGTMSRPMLELSEAEAQGLFDTLWDAGLRPSNKANESDTVQAKNDHIQDLRSVLDRIQGEFRASG